MTALAPLPKDHPIMIAWEKYKASDQYANAFQWAHNPDHRDGSMWNAFLAGFDASYSKPLSPAPVGVTDEMVEIVAKKVADFLGYAWEGLNSHSVVEQGYRMFTHGQFGWSFHGGQPDLRNVARDLLEAALASHEPAQPKVGIIAHVDHGKANLSAHVARALAAPTDTQDRLSVTGEAEAPASPPLPESETDPAWVQLLKLFQRYNHPEPPIHLRDELVTFMTWAWYGQKAQSALTACQQEVERLREENELWQQAKHSSPALEAARARNAELERSLNQIDALDPEEHLYGVSHDACRGLIARMGEIARATLGGQSNE